MIYNVNINLVNTFRIISFYRHLIPGKILFLKCAQLRSTMMEKKKNDEMFL